MPAPLLKSFASKSGKPLAHVEKCWKQAKRQVKNEYKIDEPEPGDANGTRFYKLAVGITKKMLSIDEWGNDPWTDPAMSGVTVTRGNVFPPRAGNDSDVGHPTNKAGFGGFFKGVAKPFKEKFTMKVASVQRFAQADPPFLTIQCVTSMGLGVGRWQPALDAVEMILPVDANVATGQLITVTFDFK